MLVYIKINVRGIKNNLLAADIHSFIEFIN